MANSSESAFAWHRVRRVRTVSHCFKGFQEDRIILRQHPALSCNGRLNTPSISDGVFVMVAPLSVGHHTIHFTGALLFTAAQDGFDFIFSQDITYNIEVRPAN